MPPREADLRGNPQETQPGSHEGGTPLTQPWEATSQNLECTPLIDVALWSPGSKSSVPRGQVSLLALSACYSPESWEGQARVHGIQERPTVSPVRQVQGLWL